MNSYLYLFKFGLIGLVEREWISILSTVKSEDIKYNDFVEIGRKLVSHLKYRVNSAKLFVGLDLNSSILLFYSRRTSITLLH